MTWKPGRDQIKTALTTGELQQVTADQAACEGRLATARTKVTTAELIADADPNPPTSHPTTPPASPSSVCSPTRGLRATQNGGHLGVEHAVRAQFGDNFAANGSLRRFHAEPEYPAYPGQRIEQTELTAAIATTKHIIDSAEKLLPHRTIYTT